MDGGGGFPQHTQLDPCIWAGRFILPLLDAALNKPSSKLTLNHFFEGRVSQHTNKMASSSPDDHYYITVDASEMDKIDKALRLSGLKFSKNNPVFGRKKAGLILALGAFDSKHNRA